MRPSVLPAWSAHGPAARSQVRAHDLASSGMVANASASATSADSPSRSACAAANRSSPGAARMLASVRA